MDLSKIDEIVFAGVDGADYPDFSDAYVESATWEDGTELTNEELDILQFQHSDFVYEELIRQMF